MDNEAETPPKQIDRHQTADLKKDHRCQDLCLHTPYFVLLTCLDWGGTERGRFSEVWDFGSWVFVYGVVDGFLLLGSEVDDYLGDCGRCCLVSGSNDFDICRGGKHSRICSWVC